MPLSISILSRPASKLFNPALLLLASFTSLSIYAPVLSAVDSGYHLEIIKSRKELHLKRGNHTFRIFKVSFGKGDSLPKRVRGDNRTPVGNYKVLDFKSDSKFHYFMQLNYPNMIDAWHGYKTQLITPDEFKQIALANKNQEMPPQNTALGGYIGIHGLGELSDEKLKIHKALNWTEGCIALTNNEINILRRYISRGTQVVIKE